MGSPSFSFGPFVLDTARGVLRHGNEPLPVGQRALAILQALLEAEGRVVTKTELMERCWPDTIVEDANLTVQIASLRKLLGTQPGEAEWILTVPRVGYRMATGPAEQADAALPARPALAVLPFQIFGSDAEQDYFADGVAAEIITALTRFRSFAVVSRSSSFVYKGRTVDIRQVATELGVRYVLEGSVRRAGERLRINAQLVEGTTGAHLWGEHFDGSLADVFDFQDRITEQVATRVEPAIEAAEIQRSRRERPGSIAVYDLYLRAYARIVDESIEGNEEAYALLQKGLAMEPDNAVLLAHAAWVLEHRTTMGWPPIGPDDVERCVTLARRGLQRADGDPRLMAQCGMALLQTGKDYDGGMAVIRAAAAANPNDLSVLAAAGVATMHCGDLDEAMEYMQRSLRLGPNDPDVRFPLTGIAMIEMMRGRYEQALAIAARSLAVNAHFDPTYWMLIAANAHLGRMEEAHRSLQQLSRIAPGVTIAGIRAGQPAKYRERIGTVLEGLRLAGMPEA
jgi:TolB-like protein/Flp pilus assembly protein TadD